MLETRVREIVIQFDPTGLFASGAPRDEHDADVHRIIAGLSRASSAEQVPAMLDQVFGEWPPGTGHSLVPVFERMATPLWTAWRSFKDDVG